MQCLPHQATLDLIQQVKMFENDVTSMLSYHLSFLMLLGCTFSENGSVSIPPFWGHQQYLNTGEKMAVHPSLSSEEILSDIALASDSKGELLEWTIATNKRCSLKELSRFHHPRESDLTVSDMGSHVVDL